MGGHIEDNKILNKGCSVLDGNKIPKASKLLGNYSELDIRKSKHRSADSKYRSKVQFMYSKVKEITNVQTTKDALLNDALKFIIKKENQLIKRLGKRNFEELKKDYLKFLRHEENLWKYEKDVNKWWTAVGNSLNYKYLLADLHSPVIDENAGFEKICRIHDEEWADQPSEVYELFDSAPILRKRRGRKKSLKQSTDVGFVGCAEHLNLAPRNNLHNSVYVPNSIYYSNNNLPLKVNEDQFHTETCNEFTVADLGLFALNKPVEFCEYSNPTEVALNDSSMNNVSAFISL